MPKSLGFNMVSKLIKLVKCQPCIWNTKSKNYNAKLFVALGWKNIKEEMKASGLSEDELRQKWKNIRDTFRRELKRYPCQSPDDYTGPWRHFKSLFFLSEPSTESEKEPSEQENNCEGTQDETVCIVKIESQEENESIDGFNTDDNGAVSMHDQIQTSKDYDLMFLKSLVPYFSHLDPMRKLVLRNKLQDILMDELADQAQ